MKLQRGFTLIELMIVVVIVGILAAFAIPSYIKYIKNGNAQEAPGNLLAMKTQAEQYYADHPATGYASFPCTAPASAKNFNYDCGVPTKDTFTFTAMGKAASNIVGWTYSIDQSGTRTSSAIDGASSTSCWITQSGGSC